MAMLDRNGIAIHYEVHGSGPALLLTHGFSATARMWDPQIQALSARHRLILWDIRGHGLSAAPQEPEAYLEREATGDMAALLDAVGADEAIIGGLSLGGYLSLAFHCDYPERTRALLIIDTGPGYKRDDGRAAWNRQANAMADSIERDGMAALSGGSAERASAEHRDLAGVVRAGRSLLTQHSPRVIESLPTIGVPSLVVVGAEDEPFLAATDYMAAKIPGAEKVVVADAGHAVNLDQPRVFNEAVGDFLERHGL